ncbi:F0F1 ATP synthase subunit B [Bartonella sp. AR 15-3]|uniref:F0F1 ATP synthase subunit B n=1 Tax=Bartonella sp. AR 15-3 TaxID=545617 RepID=UPI0001F4CC3C|nr:F0F1 ATP synthase subunit B [Bartonella sp. AR 15-3]OPB31253.1 F-type H+-transporting ATPase subunit b [Bartonella sp. AR 15-3]CBI79715.1 ATP synthase subunit b 1 (modular protein) [Bartonella sp. AR 15-3]
MLISSDDVEDTKMPDPFNDQAEFDHDDPKVLECHDDKTEFNSITEHASRVFPPFDSLYFASHFLWLAISFGFFYLFVSRIIVPRIGGVIETRRDRIVSDLDQAMRIKQETDIVIEIYEKKLAEARLEAKNMIQAANNEIKLKAELQRKKIEAVLEKKLEDAEDKIKKIQDKAMQNINLIAEEITFEIIKKLIDVDISKKSISSAVKAVSH